MKNEGKKLNQIFQDAAAAVVDIKWNEFLTNDAYYGWYYAGDGLYVIHDVMVNGYYFVKADSPTRALEIVKFRVEEAMNAGSWQDEEI